MVASWSQKPLALFIPNDLSVVDCSTHCRVHCSDVRPVPGWTSSDQGQQPPASIAPSTSRPSTRPTSQAGPENCALSLFRQANGQGEVIGSGSCCRVLRAQDIVPTASQSSQHKPAGQRRQGSAQTARARAAARGEMA